MFCQKCGSEINDMAVICPNCGCPTGRNQQQPVAPQQYVQQATVSTADTVVNDEKSTIATCALVFSFFIPIVGFILGIIGAVKYKTDKYRSQSIIAIPILIVVWIFWIIVYMN